MRIILTILLSFAFYANLSAQGDFITLDKKTYEQYLRGDYKNLKKTAEGMIYKGIDYYYLRMRIGILSYNKQRYSSAVNHFNKALQQNSWDTVSNEYIYYSYLFSGRPADANLYLKSIPFERRNKALKQISTTGLSNIYVFSSFTEYNSPLYATNTLYYEAVKNSLNITAGLESYFTENLKGSFAYSNFRKTGTLYSSTYTSGVNLNFSQNQLYAKLSGIFFPGWEISGFGQVAFYSGTSTEKLRGSGRVSQQLTSEYVGGVALSKSGFKVRAGLSFSASNFSKSSQIRGEAFLTYLPMGNLNLYMTSGGMIQSDKHWGQSYQANQEIGFKVAKFLWLEAGAVIGNSFLYARNNGYSVNNSYQIPALSYYGNIIMLLGKKISITVSPYYSDNHFYSWDLTTYTKTNKQIVSSYGAQIKLTLKY